MAATQAENVALESGKLGNGLLTYALLHDGFSSSKAPSLKEWLSSAVDDVPKLYDALEKGTLKLAKGSREAVSSSKEEKSNQKDFTQRPALFDYTRKPSQVPFVK